jgi:hypothetical protein
MPWLVVINNGQALDWVLNEQRMAFKESVSVAKLSVGAPIAIYATKAAFRKPSVDEGQLVASGRVAGDIVHEPVHVAGATYAKWCALALDAVPPLRHGAPFRPLVPSLKFIVYKDGWFGYLRRTLVEVNYDDFRVLASAVRSRLQEPAG